MKRKMTKGKTIRRFLFVLITLIYVSEAKAQPGYLGNVNAVEFKTILGPSLQRGKKFKDNNTVQSDGLRLFYASYELNYSRVLSRTFEVSAGYKYANMQAFTQNSRLSVLVSSPSGTFLQERNFLADPKVQSHGLVLQAKYYRKGSLAPIGKFIGININLNTASFSEGTEFYFGNLSGSNTNNSFFRNTREIENIDTLTLTNTSRVNSIHLKGVVGRNFPITNNLLVAVSASLPLISSYRNGVSSELGLSVLGGGSIGANDSDELLSITLKKYNRISVDVGIRYQF